MTTLLTDWVKLAHCVSVAALRRVTVKHYLIWLFRANDKENNTQKDQNKIIPTYKAHFCQSANIFLSLVSGIGGEGGRLLFSSTENKQSSKSGRNTRVLYICELQVAVLTALCLLRSPPTTRGLVFSPTLLFVHFFHHMLQHFPFSLCCFHPSSVPFFFASRYSVSVTHFLPLYQELIP